MALEISLPYKITVIDDFVKCLIHICIAVFLIAS